MVKEPENSDRDALFKKFEATFQSNFFAKYERDEVDIDEEERRKLFDKYLTRADYPTLNELKEIVIFQTAKARERYGTDAVSLNYFFNDDLEKAFKCAIRPLRFYVGYVKPEMEGEKQRTEDLSEQNTSVKRKKRAVPKSVATRRALVKVFDDSNPKIKNLDQSTCDYLDEERILVLPEWQSAFEIKTWAEAYDHPRLKNRIEAMFSKYRKKG